ncbi:hypothetical protein CN491_23665 [Bacillus cereus]|uniref:Uncharacterized protein n=1 Tax=Bacillus cereus TaxID=1396 RepID=A0A2A8LIG8_BACCE|nr:hypothetical protein CN491_23665 [Bacillus cereus]PFP73952.1 hypothetical protein COJ95_21220 [Bacillus cereus]
MLLVLVYKKYGNVTIELAFTKLHLYHLVKGHKSKLILKRNNENILGIQYYIWNVILYWMYFGNNM